MTSLILALVVLLATHFGPSRAPIRDPLVAKIGEGPFLGLYSLVTVAVLVWVVLAYRAAPFGAPIWSLGAVGAGLAWAGGLAGAVLIVTGVSGPNPTAVANQRRFSPEAGQARGILRVTRNPVMWGVGLWALGHLAANGEPKVALTMLALLVLSAGGTFSIEAKLAARKPEAFAALKAETSNLPFAALLSGRQSWADTAREVGITRPLAAVALYCLLVLVHPWIAGVPLVSMG